MEIKKVPNYINGKFVVSKSTNLQNVTNPATGKVLAQVPLGTAQDLNEAVEAAKKAFITWKQVPVVERSRYFFKFKELMEQNFLEIAKIVTEENGKTLHEAKGDLRRGIENIEVAAGMPSLMMGFSLEDIASGIDCKTIRRAMGVFAAITPFNFPAMVPMWFWPYAVGCGNTFVLKPSEQVPLSQVKIFELIHQAGFPAGVINMVQGAKEIVDGICTHPDIQGVSFVGSSPVAEHVYRLSSQNRKRVQALGGAKNFLVVMPDAINDDTIRVVTESCYGCAGERCLAGSNIVAVGDGYEKLKEKLLEAARKIQVGNGLEEGTTMGPVISPKHKERVLNYIKIGEQEGAKIALDGRQHEKAVKSDGSFLGPTLFADVKPNMTIAREEIFGPVMCLIPAKTLDEAIEMIEKHPLANTTSIFTQNGKSAREFQAKVEASMVGVNIGVPAPMSFFPFGGAKGSFFGDLKAHGRDSILFFTDQKVMITRW